MLQDCQVTWEGKEKEGRLVPLDIWGLLDLREFLGVPEVPATQESRALMAMWGLKE